MPDLCTYCFSPAHWRPDCPVLKEFVMAKKKEKVKRKLVGPSKHVKLLAAAKKEIEELEHLVEQFQKSSRRDHSRNRELVEKVDELQKKVRTSTDKIHEMYVESYDLVRCLNATREKWYRAEEKLKDLKKTYAVNVEVRMADGVNFSDVGKPSDVNMKVNDDA